MKEYIQYTIDVLVTCMHTKGTVYWPWLSLIHIGGKTGHSKKSGNINSRSKFANNIETQQTTEEQSDGQTLKELITEIRTV